jgi:hypothetical protein
MADFFGFVIFFILIARALRELAIEYATHEDVKAQGE